MSYMVSLMASLLVNLPALRASCHDLEKSELLRAHRQVCFLPYVVHVNVRITVNILQLCLITS